ncbi:MAG: hypothetical protein AAFV95_25125 [Bacteroidota bacterium]
MTPLESEYLALLDRYQLSAKQEKETFQERYRILQQRGQMRKGAQAVNANMWQELLSDLYRHQPLSQEEKVQRFSQSIEETAPLQGEAVFVEHLLQDKDIQLSEKVYYNVFPTGEFNASAYPTPHGFLCLLNRGILKLVYSIIYNSFYLLSNHQLVLATKDLDNEIAIYICKIIYDYLQKRKLSPIFINGLQLEKELHWSVFHMNVAVRNFIVAHEVGHIALGHGRQQFRAISLEEENISVLKRSHQQEFEADLFAQDLLLYSDQNSSFPVDVVGGGIAFLLIHLMIWNVQSKISRVPQLYRQPTDSHPSSFARIQRLDQFLGPRLPHTEDRNGLRDCVLLQRILKTIERMHLQISPEGQLVIHPTP